MKYWFRLQWELSSRRRDSQSVHTFRYLILLLLKKSIRENKENDVLTFHWNLDAVFDGKVGKVVGTHNQFIRSAFWSLRAKDCHCWLTICSPKNESILEVTSHLSCASSPIPRNSLCRKRGGIRGENYFYIIQRRTIKSVCPLKGDVLIFNSSTGVIFSISLASSQLSRNSLKIYRSCRVSFRCSRSLVIRKMHLHLRRSSQQVLLWLSFQTTRTNRVHFANLKRRESLDRHSGYIRIKYATRPPDVVIVLILRVFLFPVKHYRP